MPADSSAMVQTLRNQAERCRRLAQAITDRRVAETLLEMAQEFEKQADAMERLSQHQSG